MNFLWAIGASFAVSLISLVGIFALLIKDNLLKKILFLLIGFSAGGLIGGAFLHLLPESIHESQNAISVFLFTIAGFVFFLVLEKYLYWRHCHEGKCNIHAFSYLNLVGDAVHNLSDGLVMGTSFFVSVELGLVTTVAIIAHEIPQEIGDFGVLIYGGFTKAKALFWNFISALFAVLGTALGYYFADRVAGVSQVLLPVAAGGFIYIATCDLIPEIHKEADLRKSSQALFAFAGGILFMLLCKGIHLH